MRRMLLIYQASKWLLSCAAEYLKVIFYGNPKCNLENQIMIYLYWQFPKMENSCLMKWLFLS